jgi:hypothetical protein
VDGAIVPKRKPRDMSEVSHDALRSQRLWRCGRRALTRLATTINQSSDLENRQAARAFYLWTSYLWTSEHQ